MTNTTILGEDLRTRKKIVIPQEDRKRGLYDLGNNGTGKTTLSVNIILQDIQAGYGLCFLDPHGDAIKDILTRIPSNRENDVILLNPLHTSMPFGLNPFACSDPGSDEEVALTAGFVMHVFERVWGVGPETPRLAQVLRNVTISLIETNLTMAEIPRLLQDSTFRASVVRNVKNEQVRLFWQVYNNLKPSEQLERVDSTLNKIDNFLALPLISRIFGQKRDTVDWRSVMDGGKIVLVELSPRLEDVSTLIGSVIIGKILEAAYSRVDIPAEDRRFFSLVVDECQRYATEDFATLLSEARKFSIATTIAHQFRGQLSDRMKGATFNAYTSVIFQIASEDKDEVAALFNTTPSVPQLQREEEIIPRQNVITHLLNYGHEDKRVTDFVTRYLAPLELGSKLSAEPHGDIQHVRYENKAFVNANVYPYVDYGQCRYRFNPVHLQKGLLALNELFYDAMNYDGKTNLRDLYVQSCIHFCYYLGCPHVVVGEVLKKLFFEGENEFETLMIANAWKRNFSLRLAHKMERWPKETVPYRYSTNRIFLRLQMQKAGDLLYYRLVEYPELFLFWYFGNYSMPSTTQDTVFVEGPGYVYLYDYAELYPLAQTIRDSEHARYMAFNAAVADVAEALNKIPIYKGSGHWIQKEGIRQTHADKQNEIGNALTHQGRFRAKVKHGNQEYDISTDPLPPRNNVVLSEVIADIRRRNIEQGYLRPVSEVKDELRSRLDGHTPQLTSKQRV